MEGKKNEYGIVQEIKLARCNVELDGAEGGFAWFSDDNDALLGVEFKEFPKLIEFLKQFIKQGDVVDLTSNEIRILVKQAKKDIKEDEKISKKFEQAFEEVGEVKYIMCVDATKGKINGKTTGREVGILMLNALDEINKKLEG